MQTGRKHNGLHICINTHLIQYIQRMYVTGWQSTLITMKMPPEWCGSCIDMGSPQINKAGLACSLVQFCKERHNILYRIKHMAADHYISLEIVRRILPGSL